MDGEMSMIMAPKEFFFSAPLSIRESLRSRPLRAHLRSYVSMTSQIKDGENEAHFFTLQNWVGVQAAHEDRWKPPGFSSGNDSTLHCQDAVYLFVEVNSICDATNTQSIHLLLTK